MSNSDFSGKFKPIGDFSKHIRYRGAKGGRAGAKSHFFAEVLVNLHYNRPDMQTVCIREIQKSLKFSSKKLIEDKIAKFNLTPFFDITLTEIRRKGGKGLIVFQGMMDHTADSIKSLEGFDLAWVEEAQKLSHRSMELLLPTIRKPGSEIWFSWNPDAETDPVDELARTDPDFVCVHVNYTDNLQCPDIIKREAQKHLERDPDTYPHIWLGEYQTRSSEQVLHGKWRVAPFEPGKDWAIYHGLDFGFSQDPTAAVQCFVYDETLYIRREAGRVGLELDHTTDYLKQRITDIEKYVIRADSARPESISYLKKHGLPRITAVSKWAGSVFDGVAHLRSYKEIVIHPDCKQFIHECGHYKHKVDKKTGDILPDIIDADNHYLDACFSGDTLVCVNGEVMRFDEIPKIGFVDGPNGEQVEYKNGGFIKYDKVYSVTISNGVKIHCTADHEFLTLDGWVKAIDLKGRTLCESKLFQKPNNYLMGNCLGYTRAKSILQEHVKNCIEWFMNTITAIYQKGLTFTTKITTDLITTLETFFWCNPANIEVTTFQNITQKIQILQKSKWSKTKKSAGLGTAASQEINGIRKITRKTKTSFTSAAKSFVKCVKRISMAWLGQETIFVRTNADQHLEENQESITSKESASFAAMNLKLANTKKLGVVVEVAQIGYEPTYCLTVPKYECFSLPNGLIVSNCRYALAPLIKAGKTFFVG